MKNISMNIITCLIFFRFNFDKNTTSLKVLKNIFLLIKKFFNKIITNMLCYRIIGNICKNVNFLLLT
ncbi:hypothetical protein CQA53_02900 [Helicobacter didelphidarum]|uniref:Uncharacterized protein n=1 Tax=Helicobacter didelphidarum TaxID=2040648 RepID=A0A3D8IP91_9HELI|nr:hypothetical protein CQA53_02900 [Helicobacter didelphidarum]